MSFVYLCFLFFYFFFFNDTATTEIYTLSLHDALPIWPSWCLPRGSATGRRTTACRRSTQDRKSTRLNSSHQIISYAVFCLKKKKKKKKPNFNILLINQHILLLYPPYHLQHQYVRVLKA